MDGESRPGWTRGHDDPYDDKIGEAGDGGRGRTRKKAEDDAGGSRGGRGDAFDFASSITC
jgi:hypothetical protein